MTASSPVVMIVEDEPQIRRLDLGLPDGDGIELAKKLREWTAVPIIVISARGREYDKVLALDAGADEHQIVEIET